MTSFRAHDSENIFDATIRAYGNINGLSGFVDQVDSLDDNLSGEYETPTMVFVDYVPPTQPVTLLAPVVHVVGEGQSIYDLATQMTGKLQGLENIIANFTNLDEDIQGTTLTVARKDDPQLTVFLDKGFIFASRVGFEELIDSDLSQLIDSDLEILLTP